PVAVSFVAIMGATGRSARIFSALRRSATRASDIDHAVEIESGDDRNAAPSQIAYRRFMIVAPKNGALRRGLSPWPKDNSFWQTSEVQDDRSWHKRDLNESRPSASWSSILNRQGDRASGPRHAAGARRRGDRVTGRREFITMLAAAEAQR